MCGLDSTVDGIDQIGLDDVQVDGLAQPAVKADTTASALWRARLNQGSTMRCTRVCEH
jgi:hypothetical protein